MNNLKIKGFALICLNLFSFIALSQDPIIFVDQSHLIPEPNNIRLILPAAIADINGDYRDDIIQYDEGIYFHIQIDSGQSFYNNGIVTYEDNQVPTTLNIGDIDNSGVNDLVLGTFYDDMTVMKGQNGILSPIVEEKLSVDLFAQGSSLMDVNNDGWLDAMMTHDDNANVLMINDGAGQLMPSSLIDFNTIPVSDNSGNYSAIWFDADNDNDLDLYISKCKIGVTDPTNPQRINTLHINDNGVYIESATEYGLDIGDQSWAADSGDLDNDGDIDLVIVQHGSPHIIMENTNGIFTRHELTHLGQPILTEDLQVSISDFNNDGLQDVLIAGLEDYLFVNQGDLNFSVDTNPFGFLRTATFALGDLNEDGYTDVLAGVLGFKDKIWINNGGGNNYIKFSLNGIESNKSGIGAKLHVHTASGNYVKWLKSGVAYGITHSLNVNFGIGTESKIDSIVCLWPSGIRDIYTDVNINTHYLLTESKCMEPIVNIFTDDDVINCAEDNAVLVSHLNTTLEWNTGVVTDSLLVTDQGFYFVIDSSECKNISQIIEVEENPSTKPELSVSDDIFLCEGETLELTTSLREQLIWSNDIEAVAIEIAEAGSYYAYIDVDCKSIYSDTIIVEYIEIEGNDISEIYTSQLVDTLLTTNFGNITWYSDSLATILLTESDTLSVGLVASSTVFYFVIESPMGDCSSEVYRYEIIIDTTSSINDINNKTIIIYPNPASEVLEILSEEIIDHITICDVKGSVLYTSKIKSKNHSIRVHDWLSGIYVVSIVSAKSHVARKIIKL